MRSIDYYETANSSRGSDVELGSVHAVTKSGTFDLTYAVAIPG